MGSDGVGQDEVREALGTRAPRAHGLGLRAQIVIALGIGFALSVPLLGITTAGLGGRALDADRRTAAEATALALARSGDRRALEAVVGHAGVVGGELDEVRLGQARGSRIEARDGAHVAALWVEPSSSAARGALTGLLFLYVGATAAAILLLAYVLLGRSIVRPIEDLTRASERLARGREASVPVRGAAEVARLAVAFNAMQSELRSEHTALEERLAELERTTAELRRAQASLVRSEKLASVGRLAAGVAHEIGNPIAAILGFLELLRGGDLEPADQQEFLRRIDKETQRIHAIIRDLLDFARAEPAEEAGASCDPVEVIEDAVRLVGPQKDLRQVTIERRVPEEVPHVRGSADRLTQVVLNLLLNAADAIAGEGTITIEVELGVEPVEGVTIAVTDSGPGIAPEVRQSLFEPFVTTKRSGKGTGLGLAVCQTIVERLGGTIEAGDAEGGGARFAIHLPAA